MQRRFLRTIKAAAKPGKSTRAAAGAKLFVWFFTWCENRLKEDEGRPFVLDFHIRPTARSLKADVLNTSRRE